MLVERVGAGRAAGMCPGLKYLWPDLTCDPQNLTATQHCYLWLDLLPWRPHLQPGCALPGPLLCGHQPELCPGWLWSGRGGVGHSSPLRSLGRDRAGTWRNCEGYYYYYYTVKMSYLRDPAMNCTTNSSSYPTSLDGKLGWQWGTLDTPVSFQCWHPALSDHVELL